MVDRFSDTAGSQSSADTSTDRGAAPSAAAPGQSPVAEREPGPVGPVGGGADHQSDTTSQPGDTASQPGDTASVNSGLENEPADLERPTTSPEPRPHDRDEFTDTPLMAEAAEVHVRWQEIQAAFVDDPRGSVTRAASLAEDAVNTVMTVAQARVRELRDGWESDGADTEQLRNALRRYRMLIDRLCSA